MTNTQTAPPGSRTLIGLAHTWEMNKQEAYARAKENGWTKTGLKDGNGDELYAPPGANHDR